MRETRVWFNKYFDDWMKAFPIGNGRVGGMVYGGPHTEKIEINEESLWAGRQIEEEYDASPEILSDIRKLLFEENYEAAAELCANTLVARPSRIRPFESFGEIFIDFPDKSDYTSYKKELDLSEAIVKTSYEKNGVKYQSETFISEKYDVLVYKIKSDGKPFAANVTMERGQDAFTYAINNKFVYLEGKITYQDDKERGSSGEGIEFGSKIAVVSDGVHSAEKKTIKVNGATCITVFAAFETNYNIEKFDIDSSVDYKANLDKAIEKVLAADYDDIKSEHIAYHKPLFERVKFDIEGEDRTGVPTDVRIRETRGGKLDDHGLVVLYYNFGRYLLTECSGKNAKLPAHLQGIWVSGFTPPWNSDYHTNINLQMNYWPAENANMHETVIPFIEFMKKISKFGEKAAQKMYGARGWQINHTTDIFGRCGVHDSAQWGFFPMAGVWLCLNLFEHYEFTCDEKYFDEIYPVLKGACSFAADYLTEGPDGYLTTAPSNSPENFYFYTDKNGEKKTTMLTYGATIDFEIIRELYVRMIKVLSDRGIEKEFTEELKGILDRLPSLKISERYNTICEWNKDYEESEPGHRHISHLYSVYPGTLINEQEPEFFEAAKRTIKRRIDNGSGASGWSRAWTTNFYARFKDGENAIKNLRHLLAYSTAENLFDIHPPFQIDGNFGGTAAIMEMLVQSHLGDVSERITELLPALPCDWKNGQIEGVKVRGNFELAFAWQNGKVKSLTVKSLIKNTFRLKISEDMKNIKTNKAYSLENGVLITDFDKGECAKFQF